MSARGRSTCGSSCTGSSTHPTGAFCGITASCSPPWTRAVEEIRRFGVAVTTRRREEDDCISYTIRIPKSAKKEREPK